MRGDALVIHSGCTSSGSVMMIRSAGFDRIIDTHRLKAHARWPAAVGAVLAIGDDHLDAAVAQVQAVGMALRAEADDGNGLALEGIQRGVFFVNHWMQTMANSITAQGGGSSQVPQFVLTVDQIPNTGNLAASISQVAGTGSPQSNGSGEIIILIDYYNISANADYGSTHIGSTIANFLMSTPVDGINLASLPIHEIGVSRGAGILDGVNLALGQAGIWVDQETYLDPEPIAAQQDPPSTIYDNVEFVDDYWRNDGSAAQTNDGNPVNGAYNLNVSWLDGNDAGYSTPHLAPAGYYIGTIDQNATQSGEGPIYSNWYGDTPTMPARNATGWIYSQEVGASRPSSGLWAASGGTAARTAAGQSGTQWGNLSDLTLTSGSTITSGDPINASFIYQDRGGADTVTFYLDSDRNPFNGSFAATLGSFNLPQSSVSAGDNASLSTTGVAAGTYWVCAQITDAAGNTRYAYSPVNSPLTIQGTAAPTPPTPTPPTPTPPTPTPPVQTSPPLPATIAGSVFIDALGTAVFYPGAPSLAGVTVYVDSNKSGQYQPGDPSAVTDANGFYSITGLTGGVPVTLNEVLPAGFRQTTAPASPITPVAGQTITLAAFGDTQSATISGVVAVSSAIGAPATGSAAGFRVVLTQKPKHGKPLKFVAITNAAGIFSFNGLTAGVRDTIQVMPRKGFKLQKHTRATQALTLTDAQVVSDMTFSEVLITSPSRHR
jgi:hypothetical protein